MATTCPVCQRNADVHWLGDTELTLTELLEEIPESLGLDSGHSVIWLGRCTNADCRSLSHWLRYTNGKSVFLRRHREARQPPNQGLEPEETELYREAAAVAGISPRSACALLRLLLESLLKRHLSDAGHSTNRKQLFKLIEMAEQKLELSSMLKRGLGAIRAQGNEAAHDIYGISAETAEENLEWLFVAIDQLIDDLYVKPQKWAELEQRPGPEEEPF